MSAAVAAAVKDLAPTFAGRLIQPADPLFDEARRVHNGMIDKQPALVAQCRGAADIAEAVQLARRLSLEIAVRGGGHNVGGRGTLDAGLVIDLSLMKGIHVDPRARTARVQGGALWREFFREAQLHGLATTGGVVGSTGVGGLTLGGGLGWLMARHGMALDNVRSIEVVTADGAVKRAAADEHPDLYWAMRGGGGNFGVAASFEFQVHPVGPMITGGLVAHPIATARDVLRFYRELTASLSDDMMLVGGLLTAPDGVTKIVAIIAGHFGPLDAGATDTRKIKEFGQPIVDVIGPMPYTALNSMLDGDFPRGARNYWKSQFLPELSDAAIDALIECALGCPSPNSAIVLEHFHGAATRVAPTATAYALRSTGYNLVMAGQWKEPADDAKCIAWTRNSHAALESHAGAIRYLNYIGQDETDSALTAAYGPNLSRLREIKKAFDPDNVFHQNVNIKPV